MRSLWTAPLAVLLVVVSCGDDDAGTTTTTTIPVAAVLDLDDHSLYEEPSGLSYRTTLSFRFDSETPTRVEGRLLAEGGRVLGPPGVVDLIARVEGGAASPTCFSFQDSPGFLSPYDTFLEDGGMLTGEAQLLEAGTEENGRTVNRYQITMENIDPTDDAGSEVDELFSGYIDVDAVGGFVVSLYLTGRGRSDLLTGSPSLVGDIEYDLDFSDFGEVTDLLTPDFC